MPTAQVHHLADDVAIAFQLVELQRRMCFFLHLIRPGGHTR